MKTHELKTDPELFAAVTRLDKTYEIRKNDRDFKTGDILHLRQTKNTGLQVTTGAELKHTGRECWCKITHILEGPIYGLKDGWVIMSIMGVVCN